MQYATAVPSSESILPESMKLYHCAQLGCTVHSGKFKQVDKLVIDKTDSLAFLNSLFY